MKQNTQAILGILKDENFFLDLSNLLPSYGQHVHHDISFQEAYDNLLGIKELLITEIEKGRFDSESYINRAAVLSYLSQIQINRGNPTQIINLIDALQNQINLSGIQINRLGKTDFTSEIKELGKLKRSLSIFIKQFEQTQSQLEFISNKKEDLKKLIASIENSKILVETNKVSSEKTVLELSSTLVTAKQQLETIKESQKTVEETKLGITTFSENIEEYKSQIEEIEKKANEVIAKDHTISKLITDAREALKLGSATGISAAFSAQYDLANDRKNYKWWIRGAIISLLLAAGFTAWAIGGWHIKNPDSISSIMARIVGVAVTISAAAFCAKQYVNQKNIAEDYAYKAVLSKSIVAFTEELSISTEGDSDEHIKHYLTKVLDEIHKDPQRSRKEYRDNNLSKNSLESLQKLADIINKVK